MSDDHRASRIAMHSPNRLKIGLFGANCSSGRAVTLVPERWSGTWEDGLALAQAADAAGLEFLLPVGRWKGYGGDTDYQGSTLETVTWAAGLLACTRRITVFGTVHAPLFNPLIAAKEFVTADQIGRGRFGLNIVCGWNEGEFDMFGVRQRDHERRYEYAHEWVDIVKRAWGDESDWDFDGEFFHLKGIRMKPKPFNGTQPLLMNAGASGKGRAFALRNCDAFFTVLSGAGQDRTTAHIAEIKEQARGYGREIAVYTVGVVTCRPTQAEAEAYHRHAVVENADWNAVRDILALKNISRETVGDEAYETSRRNYANGMGGVPIVGDPDHVADALAGLVDVGIAGIGISFINYLQELPYFVAEVLPRLEARGLRAPS